MIPWLTLVTFTPLAGLVLILPVSGQRVSLIRGLGVLFSFLPVPLSLVILQAHDPQLPGFQLVERVAWIPALGIEYHLGVDGISVPMVLLTALLSALAALASWNITERAKEYWVFYLLLQVGMFGTFVAIDLFVFYIFWEIVLVPMYFLIGIWGGPRRQYAAIKFFLYTLAGSVVMLLGFLALYFASEPHTLSIPALLEQMPRTGRTFQCAVFIALFLGFAVKVPVFPFHTWLPDAHVEAPTPISVILAGVLLKMGTYGIFRLCYPMLPAGAQEFGLLFAVLGTVAIVYAAFVAMAQRDFKKLVAYSSVSHMGFVLLGMAGFTLAGMSGAYFQTFSHGILSGAMFLVVGVLYDRAHTRDLDAFGGLMARMPVYGGLLILFSLGSLGLPGLSGFIAEFFSLLGAWQLRMPFVIVSGIGIVITAAFMLLVFQRVLLGPLNPRWAHLPEIGPREVLTLVPLAVITVALGLMPWLLTEITDPALDAILRASQVPVP
ncbi:MAG: NADH-quinone oxidoreductase subunit M [Candidatus Sumerlaeia bacterium]|nr:NADH-quinone oxidoreductase subunit M [Candidatus Sumerlaeia bacterium]